MVSDHCLALHSAPHESQEQGINYLVAFCLLPNTSQGYQKVISVVHMENRPQINKL